jgi:hypothetical protein
MIKISGSKTLKAQQKEYFIIRPLFSIISF